ncbi:hypothetical protein CF165_39460 [Amycolatopsis vastitatis]|uniref:Uncharacterized protein n=2 Tax=Amycolatopsis vastitatis TaxID=1905142 RepID=A0A229SQ14_9PSEU|nr:hypothetical protein CF165_39460 [Amycolatopsis vastitatis]
MLAYLLIWVTYFSDPLITLFGREYDNLQDLELLQPIDLNEDYALYTALAAFLLPLIHAWWRYAAAQHVATGDPGWGRHARWLRTLTRADFFLMISFGAEVFDLGWNLGVPLAFVPIAIEACEHWKNIQVKVRGNRLLAWLHRTALRANRSQPARRVRQAATIAGRAVLTFPALAVLLEISVLLFLLPPVSAEPLVLPVEPASPASEACVRQVIGLADEYGLDPETDDQMEREADKLHGEGVLSTEQYDFVRRLRAVTKERFAGPDTGPAERRWSYEYVQRIAGTRCNGWYPAPPRQPRPDS